MAFQGRGPDGSGQAARATRTVNANGDFQSALNSAQPGDTIVLEVGSTYTGNFTLPNKPGSEYVTVTSSALSSLPPDGVRVNPSFAHYMPKLVSPNDGPAVRAAAGAHHYRFVGIEFHPKERVYQWGVITIGEGNETSLSALPHDFVFDRVYIHGDPAVGSKRGIALNGASITVENSYISDFKSADQDTQALCGWNGPGPFRIVNNYLEAAAENILFGGSKASIPNLVASDITVTHNYFFKPLSWNPGDPSYAGTRWSVKNSFELKNARRVVVDGNIFQCGGAHAILFTPRTEERANPWAVVKDVTFTHNIVRHACAGVEITGHDDDGLGGVGADFTFRDNLFEDIKSTNWPGGNGRLWAIYLGAANAVIDHNTGFEDMVLIMTEGAEKLPGLVFSNNIAPFGRYGIMGLSASQLVMKRNVIYGDWRGNDSSPQPTDNFFPGSIDKVGFASVVEGQYQLSPASRYKSKGTDGKDIGADFGAIRAANAGVIEGRMPRVESEVANQKSQ
jgi:hypothetical protein